MNILKIALFFLGIFFSLILGLRAQIHTTGTGDVGIGTNLPAKKLHVLGDVRFQRLSGGLSFIDLFTTSTASHILVDDPGTAQKSLFISVAPTSSSGDDRHIYFRAGKSAGALLTRMTIRGNGNVGIGTETPSQKLDVNGTIRAKEVNITTSGWADYVFRPEYSLRPLSEVEAFIVKHGHLPNIPSEKEVLEKGVNLLEMNAKLLEKIEELTLYMIQLNSKNLELERKLTEVYNNIK